MWHALTFLPGATGRAVSGATMTTIALAGLMLSTAVVASALQGADADAVNRTVAQSSPPAGIVFEIVTGDRDDLMSSLPRVRSFVEQLRQAHPELPVAVVTHGSEQFALMEEQAPRYSAVHSLVRELRDDVAIDVEVCGNHARLRGVSSEAFPDYVKVVPGAGVAISDYVDKGYVLIIVD